MESTQIDIDKEGTPVNRASVDFYVKLTIFQKSLKIKTIFPRMNILYALVYTHRRVTYQMLNISCIPNKKIKSISNYRAKIRHCHNQWNGKFTGVLIRNHSYPLEWNIVKRFALKRALFFL